jgi:hypothetical protein
MCSTAEPVLMECTSAMWGDNADTFQQIHTPLTDKERTECFVSLCVWEEGGGGGVHSTGKQFRGLKTLQAVSN